MNRRRLPLTPPADLNADELAVWNELEGSISANQSTILANLARNRCNLLSIRKAKAEAVTAGTFSPVVIAKNGAPTINLLIREETRLVSLENRMLRELRIGDECYF